ncbi:MAG: efflux RND transporter permease subunit [Deltaproteobacteria bacterium]|nr:efflux RND transporter permease subunit [Deltaproteobacteria bacterium]
MILLERLLGQRKLVLTLVGLLALLGLLFWVEMPRQEDPRLPDFWGLVVVPFPGTDAETVERLVLEPLEEHLAAVDDIKEISSSSYSELAVLQIDLRDSIKNTDKAWDEVREALSNAQRDFPAGVGTPELDDELQDQESIVYALTGQPDPLVLMAAAEDLKDRLLTLPSVSEVKLTADPGDQITIAYDDSTARRLGLDPRQLAGQLQARNRILPGGSVELAGRTVTLRPLSEFESVEEIRSTPILLPDGNTVPLAAVADVRRGPEEPAAARMRLDGEAGIGIGIVPRVGGNLLDFGTEVRDLMTEQGAKLTAIQIDEIIFQPDRVEERLRDLSRSLLLGVLIVAGLLILAMGMRLGLIVASVVPLVVLTSLAVYAIGGGVLHQISIAALVIALGMLVDNAIVMAENIQWRIDRGERPHAAALGAVRELAVPLAAATATTLAAFVPMLLAEGGTGEFTRAIPIVIMLTLTISYLFAVFVTPALSEIFLRPQQETDHGGGRLQAFSRRIGQLAVRRAPWVVILALVVVGLSLAAAGNVKQQFFPSSDRNQLVVDLKLPEGSHLDATDEQSRSLERALLQHPEVVSVAAFVGRSTPKFYYNLNSIPWSPHLAQLIVETTSTATLDSVMAWLRETVSRDQPALELVVRKLEQGPSIEAPVEIRLLGEDLEALGEAAGAVLAELRPIPGVADARHTLGTGAPTMQFRINDAAAAVRGLSREDVAISLFGRTRGLPVGEFRAEDDPIPVVLRSTAGERLPAEELGQVDVARPGGAAVPLSQVAKVELEWRPAAIHHYNRSRVVRVLSELEGSATYSDVLRRLTPRLEALSYPEGVRWEVGGAAAGSDEANLAVMRVLPVGVLLLLAILMAEFRSLRRVGIVLVTVPLAAAGVIPGLLLAAQPFGFMSSLGVFALIGVVVNNAIVLLEVVESRRSEGADLATALTDAVERRLRPILLTTATTVAGLTPLAFSPSTLWPPMAWAMISGLIGSTFLTIMVVPALYALLFARKGARPFRWGSFSKGPERGQERKTAAAMGALFLFGLVLPATAFGAETREASVTLAEAMEQATDRPRALASQQLAQAARQQAKAERRGALLPSITVGVMAMERSEDFEVATPFGDLRFGDRGSEDGEVSLVQPLLAPSPLFYGAPAADAAADAQDLTARRSRQEASSEAADAFLDILAIDARISATGSFVASLRTSLTETRARVEAGRSLEADALKVQLALDSAQQERDNLQELRAVAKIRLGLALGSDSSLEPTAGDSLVAGIAVPVSVNLPAAFDLALRHRPDLLALRQQSKSLRLRRSAVRAERLPRLQATAKWLYSSGSPYRQDNWFEGGIGVSWRPFASGTRGPRVAALAEQGLALESQLLEAERGVRLQVASALAALTNSQGNLLVGESGVVQAAEALRVERERHQAGRVTTNDLLQGEAALRDQRTQRDLARLELVRSWIHFQLALGQASGAAMLPPGIDNGGDSIESPSPPGEGEGRSPSR